MLREVVHAVNVAFRREISWPTSASLVATASAFQDLCGLPSVLGAIDGTHIAITKPSSGATDYYYFKSGGYSMNCQAVVDSSKRFLDLYVGMPGYTNDSRMLRRSTLFCRGQQRTLWDLRVSFNGFAPYLLGDSGYPLLPWLMVPHRHQAPLIVADTLFNRKLSKGRAVVENAFALLKMTFRELHTKLDLSVTFLPDVVICCAILHNILLEETHKDVEHLLEVLRTDVAQEDVDEARREVQQNVQAEGKPTAAVDCQRKRQELGVFLAQHWYVPQA